ncbi:MAG TPA: hypothetical protein VNL38_01685 [Candidatus Nitrosotenuis sp.]|nr:hypothetical protein [Candidatus Nitrosotenuis sp.]
MAGFLIFAISLGALAHFLFSYVRSLLSTCADVPLSEETQRLAHVDAAGICGNDFARLNELLEITEGNFVNVHELRAVRVYHALLSALFSRVPRLARWAERERRACAYFAAVALDCRLTHQQLR